MAAYYDIFACNFCPVLVAVNEEGAVLRVDFLPGLETGWTPGGPGWCEQPVPDRRKTAAARTQLEEYFAGKRRVFTLPLAVSGTKFQRRVWDELRRIPYGETLTYAQVAARIGQPAACRAVGRANGANRIPVLIPCHRVIGARGDLTGFAGGLPLKRFLLRLEGIDLSMA
ncbi:MAG: methylated-DNA--[protein]-cysteine S-methyltransferase [Bacteroidota bacterium]